MRVPTPLAVLGALLALGACTDVVASGAPAGPRAVPALLRFAGTDARVAVPDTVAAGAPFTLVVTTFGGGCVREALAPVARAAAGGWEVSLFDRDTGAGTCTDDLLLLEHRVPLQAGGRGALALRVHGASRGAETGWTTVPWIVTRTIVVR